MAAKAAIALAIALSAACAQAAESEDLPRRAGAVPETYPGVEVLYESVRDPEGHRIRTIITHPKQRDLEVPALFIVGWLSCDGIEAPADTNDASGKMFRLFARMKDLATIRMDKPGLGDSEGDCSATDFQTELGAYRAAFESIARYDFIDKRRIFVMGISNGGGVAPLVAGNYPVRGFIIDGGWVKSWFEHMLEIERRRLTLKGLPPSEVNRQMSFVARFYEAYLIEGKRPAEIFGAAPELRQIWTSKDDEHLYGRPVAYYQQLQALNLEAAWAKVSAPVLALHGQFDWIMSRDDHERIVALANANRPGKSKLIDLPNTGHTFEHYPNWADAFAFKEAPFDPAPAKLIERWIAERAL